MTRIIQLAVTLAAFIGGPARADNEKCTIFAEIAVEAVSRGSLAVCVRSAHPGVCSVATILNNSTAARELSKTLTSKGCEFLVEKVGGKFHVTITGKKAEVDAAAAEFRKAKDLTVGKN
jgi:hypothetical protein